MNQKRCHRTITKFSVVAGIAATIGVSVAIHAASLSTISTSTTIKTLTPTTTITKTPISTVPSTTPLKVIAPVAPTTLTPTQTKTITPTLTTPTVSPPPPSTSTKEITPVPTPTTSPSPTTTKELAPQTEPTAILPATDTKPTTTTTPTTIIRRLTNPSPNPLTITPTTPTTPIEKTTSPGALEIPVKLIAPIEKIAPLPPQTPSIILPLKDVTKDTITAPTEFLITTPTKNTDSIPLMPVDKEKTEENSIIIQRRIIPKDTNSGRTRTIDLPVKQPETPAELPFTETTLTETSLVSDVSESNRAYAAIVEMLELMKEKGNYALPKSKKFRPKNKVGWAFGAQLALSISGESCGEMRGRNKRTVCVAKAMTIGLIDKSTVWNKPMTKGEFYELILNALKIPAVEPAGDTICVDVDATHKFANVIATAKYYGITKRYSFKGEGGYCLLDAALTKADAAVIASKALEAKKNLQQ